MARGGIQIRVSGTWNGKALERATADLRNLGKSATTTANTFADRAQRMGAAAMVVGKHMTKKLTLPLAAVGAAATKASVDFEDSFAKIQGLVGVSADETNRMREAALGLAGQTAVAPRELGDAMFFVASAGLRGQDALDALEFSARASAAGLGETKVVADLVTSAMNAYGPEVLGAAQATDALTAAVRLGKLEPAELAGSMGAVLPIASAMGVGFDEVSAAMAAMSRTGTDAASGATQLRQILSQLVKPTTQAQQALQSVGLSVEDVHQSLRERGLLATLQDLQNRFNGNVTAMSSVFGNIRALSGVLDMLGSNAAETEAIFSDMANTTGELDAAFEIASQTAGFKMRQAMVNLQTALVSIGDVIAPVVAAFAQMAGGVAKALAALPRPIQTVIASVGMFVASLGPLLWAWGAVTRALGTFIASKVVASLVAGFGALSSAVQGAAAQSVVASKAITGAGIAMQGATKFLLGSVGVIGAVGVAFRELWLQINKGKWGELPDDIDRTTIALQRLANNGRFTGILSDFDNLKTSVPTLMSFRSGLDSINSSPWWSFGFNINWNDYGKGVREGADEAIAGFAGIDSALAQMAQSSVEDGELAAEAFSKIEAELAAMGASAELITFLFPEYGAAVNLAGERSAAAAEGVQGLAGGLGDTADEAENATSKIKEFEDAVRAQIDPVFRFESAQRKLDEANLGAWEAQGKLTDAIDKFGDGSPEAIVAASNLEKAQLDVEQSAIDAFFAEENLINLVQDGQVTFDDLSRFIGNVADAQKLTGEQADRTRGRFKRLIDQMEKQPSIIETQIKTNAQQVWADAIKAQRELDALERTRIVTISFQSLQDRVQNVRNVLGAPGRALGGPVQAARPYMVGERGPELVIPSSDGWVMNHAETRRLLSSTTGGNAAPAATPAGGDTYNITINGLVGRDKQEVLDYLARELPRAAAVQARRFG